MLFADNIVLIGETKGGLNDTFEQWRQTLESRGFRLSRSKTEYLKCEFSGVGGDEGEITMVGAVIPRVQKFKYLGSILEDNRDIDDDINYRIRVGWQKWRNASGILCDKKNLVGLKGKVYRTVVRPALLYGTECWAIKKTQVQRLMVTDMRMIRWICGYSRLDRTRNVVFRKRVSVAPIEDKMRETRLRWFGHVMRRGTNEPVRRCEMITMTQHRRGRGRPKMCWRELIRCNLKYMGLTEDIAQYRVCRGLGSGSQIIGSIVLPLNWRVCWQCICLLY